MNTELDDDEIVEGFDAFETYDLGLTTEQLEAIAKGEVPDGMTDQVEATIIKHNEAAIEKADPSIDWVTPETVKDLDKENLKFCLTEEQGYRKWLLKQFIVNEAKLRMLDKEKRARK